MSDLKPTRKNSSSSTSSLTTPKGVQFSKFVKVSYTFGQTEYDRNPIDVDEMTSMDYYEFYQMQYQMYQTMKAEITLRQLGMMDVSMPNFDHHAGMQDMERGLGTEMEGVGRAEDYFLSSRSGVETNVPEHATVPSMAC